MLPAFVHCTLKFEDDSSDGGKNSPSTCTFAETPQQEVFDDDPQLPLILHLEAGYPVHFLIQTLLASNVDKSRVCKVQPLGVMQNAMFMIDLDEVHFNDVKADDLHVQYRSDTRYKSNAFITSNERINANDKRVYH